MEEKCLGNYCMADKEWPSVVTKGEYVCCNCPKFTGKDLPDPRKNNSVDPLEKGHIQTE